MPRPIADWPHLGLVPDVVARQFYGGTAHLSPWDGETHEGPRYSRGPEAVSNIVLMRLLRQAQVVEIRGDRLEGSAQFVAVVGIEERVLGGRA